MSFQLSRSTAALALCLTLLPWPLSGQMNPTGARSPEPATDSVVTLSPFEVNTDRDTGYQAANTLAGGRIETAVDRTPAAISILTREFLDDIAANNFNDAAVWSPNSFLVAPTSDFSDYRVDFRSTNQAGNNSVNYFPFGQTMDSFSTERLEFSRGPNSILFGEGNLSGIVTVNLKQPRFRNFGQVQFRVDDLKNLRVSLDVNRALFAGKAALRVAALVQDGERWRKPSRDDRRGLFAAGAVKIGDSAGLRFEAEFGQQVRSWGDQNFFDNASAWNGTPYTGNGTTAVPANAGMAAIPTTADYLVYNPAHPERGVLNYRGFARSSGNAPNLTLLPEGRAYVPNFPALPATDFDIQPPNNVTKTDYYFTTLYLEKRFTRDLFAQFSINRRYRDVSREGALWVGTLRKDPNTFLPNGQANPDFGKFYVDGEPTIQRQWSDPRDFRLLGTYRLATSWMEQRLSAYASYARNLFRLTNERLVRADNSALPSPTNGGNFIQQRYYLDRSAGLAWQSEPSAFGGAGVRKYRNSQSESGATGVTSQLASVGSYFGGRLSTIVGIRRDDTDRLSVSSAPDATGALVLTRRDFGEVATTPTAGAVWYPIPQFGPFFNFSESFSGVGLGDPLIFSRQQPDAPKGRSQEYGFNFKLLGERLQGSVRYYDSVQKDRLVNAPGVTNINNLWNALGQNGNALTGTPRDTQDLITTGYELELVANLTRSWRTIFNYAVPRSEQNNSFLETKAYRAANLPVWQAAAATNNTVATQLTALNTAIEAGNDGREQNTALKYRLNLYSTYEFRGEFLRGLAAGAGANLSGRQLAGNVANQAFSYIWADGYYVVSGHVSYTAKLRNLRYRVQLNVTNALDTDHLIFTSVARYTAAAGSGGVTGDYFAGYRFVDPRKFTLTTTFDF
jgi:outer membrane receptor protein involved in Fe transport